MKRDQGNYHLCIWYKYYFKIVGRMLQHYFVDEQMFNSRGPLALLYRTFSKFKIERKWVIPLTHLLSVSEALSAFQVYMTSYEFPACLAEKFYHNFYMAPTASVMTQMPAGSYALNHFHCGLINLVKCWAWLVVVAASALAAYCSQVPISSCTVAHECLWILCRILFRIWSKQRS